MMSTSTETLKKGILTIAGSGIASIGHITLETLAHIQQADRIYYLLVDPATEAYIIDNTHATCVNLRGLYGPDKQRYDTYTQMSEVMLKDVRAGHNVLGIFYGHPGVFVSPSHRAIAIALSEGFEARMLPGVSAEDYLFADLRVDPCTFGCAAFEATELLYRGRRLDPTMHNIIWQVGCVGILTMVFNGEKFGLLVDRLEEDFGADHQVVHYIGAVLPQAATVAQAYRIYELRDPENVRNFTASSTFYIPPRDERGRAASAESLGIDTPESQGIGQVYPPPAWATTDFGTLPAYGRREQTVIAELESQGIPQPEYLLRASPAVRKFMADVALDPKLRENYRSNPQATIDGVVGLTPIERFGLSLYKAPATFKLMTASPSEVALGVEPTEDDLENAVNEDRLAFAVPVVAV